MRETGRREISWKQVEEGRFLLDQESRDLFLAKTKNVFEIAKIVTRRNGAVYLYAGTVRNLLLGIETSIPDYDFIGDFDLDQIQGDFPKLVVGRWDGVNTIRLKIGSYSFDFTAYCFRKRKIFG